MTPLKLRLKHFIGIKSGLGRDEIEIDFTTIDGALVALKGPNGTGKSTILDNGHAYRLMPSRAGSYSPGSFSFYDQTYGDAEKVLEWEHDSLVYRSTLLIKGATKTKKMECYLHVQAPYGSNEWGPVILPDGTSSDGKASTYDACVEYILGTPEMFFTSSFSSQGRRPLSNYTQGDIKGLMSELLGTDDVAALGTKARDVMKLLTVRREGLRQQAARADEIDRQLEQARQDAITVRADIESLSVARIARRDEAATAAQALAEARANVNLQADLEERRQTLTNQLREIETATTARCQEIQQDIQREQTAADQRRQQFESTRKALQERRTEQQGRSARAEAILARRAEIEAAGADVARLKTEQAALEAEIIGLKTTADQLRDLGLERTDIASQLKAAGEQGNNLKTYIDKLLAQAELADRVPCTGTDLQPRCELLASTLEAKAEVPTKQTALDEARDRYAQLQERGKTIADQIAAIATAQTDLDTAQATLNGLYQKISMAQRLADQVPQLEQATQDREAARIVLDEIDKQQAELDTAWETTGAEDAAHLQALRDRHEAAQLAGAAEARDTQKALAALPPPGDRTALIAAEARVTRADEAQATAEQALEQMNAKRAQLDASIETLDKQAAELATVRDQVQALDLEISQWQLLSKALGNDGIIALTIDDAGPTLADLANQLLLACYGPRFTVSIQTQTETAKGDAKETFDVRVFDGDRDDEKSVRDMSGGERVYINECLTRAIALYQAQQSGQHFGTLFADESDGALDLDRKIQFMTMKRKVLELGGYQREIFISHTPDLWDLADAVIDIGAMREVA